MSCSPGAHRIQAPSRRASADKKTGPAKRAGSEFLIDGDALFSRNGDGISGLLISCAAAFSGRGDSLRGGMKCFRNFFPYQSGDPFVQLFSGRHVLFLSLFLLRQRTIALREPLPLLIYGFSGKSSTRGDFGRFQPGNGGVPRKIFHFFIAFLYSRIAFCGIEYHNMIYEIKQESRF